MVDETLQHLRTLRDRPAWISPPDATRKRLQDEPIPFVPQGESEVYEQYAEDVRPYRNGNLDPRFYGWVQGNGIPLAMMADMLASGINSHSAGFNQSAVDVELKVVAWLSEIMGFDARTSGLLLSGGSMANFTGLIVARNAKCGFEIREEGLQGGSPYLTVYGSSETHSWAKKAVEVLGLGNKAFRRIPANADFTINIDKLEQAIRDDISAGHRPVAVLATAGTVNTGAFDDFHAIAAICEAHDIWMHVDGAFGALAAVSPNLKAKVSGMQLADSVAFDLHKWMYLPFEIACLLIKDKAAHKAAFSQSVTYLAPAKRGVSAGGNIFADLGIELTRGFKALKAWMCLKAYGLNAFAEIIDQNVQQAKYLESKILSEPKLEAMAPVPLNIVCYRFTSPELSQTQLNRLNEELLLRIQEQGIAIPSSTVLDGNFCIRCCIVNHRTQTKDLDQLVQASVTIGSQILTEGF